MAWVDRFPNAQCRLVPERHGQQKGTPVALLPLGNRQRGGDDRRRAVEGRSFVDIVQLKNVGSHAVRQRRPSCRGPGVWKDCGLISGPEPCHHRKGHLGGWLKGTGHGRAKPVEDSALRVGDDMRWHVSKRRARKEVSKASGHRKRLSGIPGV